MFLGSFDGTESSKSRTRLFGGMPRRKADSMADRRVTLPLEDVSLAEWFNSDKENGNDENIKEALHARIQARGGQAR